MVASSKIEVRYTADDRLAIKKARVCPEAVLGGVGDPANEKIGFASHGDRPASASALGCLGE